MRNCRRRLAAGRAGLRFLGSTGPASANCGCFFPALTKLTRGEQRLAVILLQPRTSPYAPAFRGAGIAPEQVLVLRTRRPEDALWACEQCLNTRPRSAVSPAAAPGPQDLRRPATAVENRPVLAVLMRDARRRSSLPARRCASRRKADAGGAAI